ncbi:MAG TPA: SGNH/GDSL hydrolase family protein [Streptosporangiaceae bacterium]|nr:SGNH/GDSL hydrolase family protein [Streptosporangiaceae bacterium]
MSGRSVSFPHPRRIGRVALALLIAVSGVSAVAAPPAASAAGSARPPGWVATWGAGAMAPSALVSTVQTLDDQTVRNIVYTSVGGSALRIRVSNAFGDRTVTIGAATVARQASRAALDPATVRRLTFGGQPSVRLARGAAALSDPVRMTVPALSTLAVSLYLPAPTGPATYHQDSRQTNYLADGDQTAAAGAGAFGTTVGTWFFLDAVQVRTTAPGAIVAVGDSITDGFNSTIDANNRWPNVLARRLAARHGRAAPAVVDEGISGNRVLSDSVCFGEDLLSRLRRDAFSQPGARTLVLLEGVNDLGFSQLPNADCTAPNTNVTPDQLISAYKEVIRQAHARGLRIFGGTILPAEGSGYWDPAAERKRVAVNAWIRGSRAFDGVIDFAAVMAAPDRPEILDPAFDSGDHLHPNDAGYAAMAAAVDHVLARHAGARAG